MHFTQKFRDFFRTVFPNGLAEVLVFLACLLVYGALAAYIALNYRIVFDDRIPWDAYFSFDNRAIVMTGGGAERHPLSNYFFGWLKDFALWISGGKKDAVFRLVLALCSTVSVSLCVVQVLKYLKNIIRLPLLSALLLLSFFGMFSTVILLSFTPETYTYTMLLLMGFNYYAALKLRAGREISVGPLAVAGVAVGGLTVTNFVKVFVPLLFENIFKNSKTFFRAVFRVVLSTMIFALLALWRLDFLWRQFFNKSGEQFEKFSNPKVTPYWDMVYSWFFGGNMLFSGFVIRDYHSKKGFEYKALFMDVYTAAFPYVAVGLVWAMVIWSYIKNFKNKLVQVLMISFAVDLTIHIILKFGLHTSYIYGGHFIYIVPLLLGWLLHAYRTQVKIYTGLVLMISFLLFYFGLNNIYRMQEFFVFLDKYYQ